MSKPMTVAELIEELQGVDQSLPVVIGVNEDQGFVSYICVSTEKNHSYSQGDHPISTYNNKNRKVPITTCIEIIA